MLRKSNHNYEYGVVCEYNNEVKIVACCGTYDLAVKRLNQEIKWYADAIAWREEDLELINNGTFKQYGFDANGNFCHCVEVSKDELITLKQKYEIDLKDLKQQLNGTKIVKLEIK